MAHCTSGRSCVSWVLLYFKDCVCGVRDYVSLALGLIGVFSWAVAEIPQIFTNFKSGSAHGLSLSYLMASAVADIFNLFGCLLEPVTLPTQFYTALLYTITTEVLVCQSLYYGYFCKWWNVRKAKSSRTAHYSRSEQLENTKTEPVDIPESVENSTELASSLLIHTISPARERSIGRNLYCMSGRSFPGIHTSMPGSYLAASRRSDLSFTLNQSPVGNRGLLANLAARSLKYSKNTLLISVASTVFVIGGLNCFLVLNLRYWWAELGKNLQEVAAIEFRDSMIGEQSTNVVGTILGWLMAAIYIGGLLPQICLNVQRGTVEGLNPLMFMFELIGHTASAGSILVRNLEWETLKPNMPWLVDSTVCAFLDLIILAQFLYYNRRKPDDREDKYGGLSGTQGVPVRTLPH